MKILTIILLALSWTVYAQEVSDLEKKLELLNLPDEKVMPLVSQDKLYIINTRYSSLVNRHEISLMGATNFMADSHLSTQQAAATYRYHLNSRFSFGLRYTRYSNKLNSAGEKLFANQQILPDTDFALNGQEAFVTFNTFYGKIRLTSERVSYFDQYISLGAGQVELASGKTNLAIADVGFALWIGKHMSARVGFKNEFYQQIQVSGEENIHNGLGYLEFGYLFGTGKVL
jgi:outer membrane beta-barrel protein